MRIKIKEDNVLIFIQMLIMIVAAIFFSYKTSPIINKFFFAICTALFLFTKKNNYFWIFFTLLLLDQFGGFFRQGYYESDFGIPRFRLISGFTFDYYDIFIIICFVKAQTWRHLNIAKFIGSIKVLIFYFIMLYVLSVSIGMSLDKHTTMMRIIFFFSSFLSFQVLMDEKQLEKLVALAHNFMPIVLLLQIFTLVMGKSPYNMVMGSDHVFDWDNAGLGGYRVIYSGFLNLFSYITSIFLYRLKDKNFSQDKLLLVMLTCYMSILLTATRGWIISYSFLMLYFFFSELRLRSSNKLRYLLVVPIFFIILLQMFPILQTQIELSFNRFLTIRDIAGGDLTAGGTLSRLTDRSAPVMDKFMESPIIGFGFSNQYFDNADQHVGNQSLLLNVGVVGFIFFIMLILEILYILSKTQRRYYYEPDKRSALNALKVSIVSILLIHSSSTQLLGFHVLQHQKKFILITAIIVALILKKFRINQKQQQINI